MSDKKFTVHVARESGHEQELMTREDIVEMVSQTKTLGSLSIHKWSVSQRTENIELNDSTEIRINLAWSGGRNLHRSCCKRSGRPSHAHDQAGTHERVDKQPRQLALVDGQMVDSATIANTELNQDNVLRLVPSIGGSETFTVQITDFDRSLGLWK